MPELRRDPVTGRWVIISTERGKRPSDFVHKAAGAFNQSDACPFCPGNEAMTPPEVLAIRKVGKPNEAGWEVRVVPNKFPALDSEGVVDWVGDGLFQRIDGVGAHEVIIECPDHQATLAALPTAAVENVLKAFQVRVRELKRDKRFHYAMLFKNHGAEAGASLEHEHSQLIALPIVPMRVREEVEGARSYYSQRERCIYCDIVQQEEQDGRRLILKNEDFIAVAPYASRFPCETWLLPRRHNACFEEATEPECASLARALKTTLASLDNGLGHPPYNFIIHSAPLREVSKEFYHWHIEIMPTLSKVAGFEWGTGVYINPTPPEEAAQILREVLEPSP
jgi:UDPglucose--hexose-1-phosphate uridylyltransferase